MAQAGGDEEMDSFKVHGPLPRGTTLLEASAGTGKTFTIAALTTRYIAEDDLPIDRLLVMTFTRMATGELRERVRDRLVRAFDGLADVLAGRPPPQGDDIVRLLADVAAPSRSCGATGWARRSPTSTPPPSRRPTDSACRSSTGSAPPATSTVT